MSASPRLAPLTESESFAWCEALARRTAKNFFLSFVTLRRERYRAMCALYAYMRVTDDLADSATASGERALRLREWNKGLLDALAGEEVPHPVFPALLATVRRHGIPPQYLLDVIDGVSLDTRQVDIADEQELARYCYLVAGAVGLCCIHIWGFRGERATSDAIACGEAFQRTNILRDVREDAIGGRFYLPREARRRFGVEKSDLATGSGRERLVALLEDGIRRTEPCYDAFATLAGALSFEGRTCLAAMNGIYGGLFRKIRVDPMLVFSKRVELCAPAKLWAVGSSFAAEACRAFVGSRHSAGQNGS